MTIRWIGRTPTLAAILAGVSCILPGCATSRYDQLRAESGRVEQKLRDEQARTLNLPENDMIRRQKLEHLTQLKYTLSAANVGLGTVRHGLPEDQRDLGYDVMEEVYSTIEWNIPLGANEPQKQLPPQFSNGFLNLGAGPK